MPDNGQNSLFNVAGGKNYSDSPGSDGVGTLERMGLRKWCVVGHRHARSGTGTRKKQGCDGNGEGDEETLGLEIDFNQSMHIERQDSILRMIETHTA